MGYLNSYSEVNKNLLHMLLIIFYILNYTVIFKAFAKVNFIF